VWNSFIGSILMNRKAPARSRAAAKGKAPARNKAPAKQPPKPRAPRAPKKSTNIPTRSIQIRQPPSQTYAGANGVGNLVRVEYGKC
jgi:hypothetical protein